MPLYVHWNSMGADLRAVREGLRMTPEQFADRISCLAKDVKELERGDAAPGISIAAHLGRSEHRYNIELAIGAASHEEVGLFTFRLIELKQQVYKLIGAHRLSENYAVIEEVMRDLERRYHLEMHEASRPVFRFRGKGALFNPTEETVRDMIEDAKRRLQHGRR